MQEYYEPKVSAVILNYNSFSDTKKCISYLKKQNYGNLNIIVVDNQSTEVEQVHKMKEYCEKEMIMFIQSDKNGGFSYGNNIGIRRALDCSAEWVLIINPDVELRDNNYIRNVLLESAKWEHVAVVGTKTLLPDFFNQNPLRELTLWEEVFFPLTYIKEKKYGKSYYKTEEKTGLCEKVVGCCFFVKREFLLMNNLLDDKVFLYCEEPILAKSVKNLGYNELYIDEMIAYHQHFEKDKPESVNKRMMLLLNSRKYYIKKYSGYSTIGKMMALLAKDIQLLIWKVKK